jgi:hypothetical protein
MAETLRILSSRFFLIAQPIAQMLVRRRDGDHEGRALVVAHFNQLGEGLRRHRAKASQQLFILRRPPSHQQMHRDIPRGGHLLGTKALRAGSGKLFD